MLAGGLVDEQCPEKMEFIREASDRPARIRFLRQAQSACRILIFKTNSVWEEIKFESMYFEMSISESAPGGVDHPGQIFVFSLLKDFPVMLYFSARNPDSDCLF